MLFTCSKNLPEGFLSVAARGEGLVTLQHPRHAAGVFHLDAYLKQSDRGEEKDLFSSEGLEQPDSSTCKSASTPSYKLAAHLKAMLRSRTLLASGRKLTHFPNDMTTLTTIMTRLANVSEIRTQSSRSLSVSGEGSGSPWREEKQTSRRKIKIRRIFQLKQGFA